MRNLVGKAFLIEGGFVGLLNSLKYKMVLLLNIPVLSSRNHLFGTRSENDLYRMTTVLNPEQTHT